MSDRYTLLRADYERDIVPRLRQLDAWRHGDSWFLQISGSLNLGWGWRHGFVRIGDRDWMYVAETDRWVQACRWTPRESQWRRYEYWREQRLREQIASNKLSWNLWE